MCCLTGDATFCFCKGSLNNTCGYTLMLPWMCFRLPEDWSYSKGSRGKSFNSRNFSIRFRETNISNIEGTTLDIDDRRTLMKARIIKAVADERISVPVRTRAKTVKNVAAVPEVNDKHSMIDRRPLFFRIIQTSFLPSKRKENRKYGICWVLITLTENGQTY